jgi:tetratricopeptide (TPR) repeat protein
MYNQLGNSEKALDYLDKAIALKPDLAQAYFNKGVILMTAKNDPRGAVAVWKKFIDIAPESEYVEFLKQQIKDIEASQQ